MAPLTAGFQFSTAALVLGLFIATTSCSSALRVLQEAQGVPVQNLPSAEHKGSNVVDQSLPALSFAALAPGPIALPPELATVANAVGELQTGASEIAKKFQAQQDQMAATINREAGVSFAQQQPSNPKMPIPLSSNDLTTLTQTLQAAESVQEFLQKLPDSRVNTEQTPITGPGIYSTAQAPTGRFTVGSPVASLDFYQGAAKLPAEAQKTINQIIDAFTPTVNRFTTTIRNLLPAPPPPPPPPVLSTEISKIGQEAVDRVGQILSGDGLPNANLPQPIDPRRQLAEDLPPVLEGADPNFNPSATAVDAEPIAVSEMPAAAHAEASTATPSLTDQDHPAMGARLAPAMTPDLAPSGNPFSNLPNTVSHSLVYPLMRAFENSLAPILAPAIGPNPITGPISVTPVTEAPVLDGSANTPQVAPVPTGQPQLPNIAIPSIAGTIHIPGIAIPRLPPIGAPISWNPDNELIWTNPGGSGYSGTLTMGRRLQASSSTPEIAPGAQPAHAPAPGPAGLIEGQGAMGGIGLPLPALPGVNALGLPPLQAVTVTVNPDRVFAPLAGPGPLGAPMADPSAASVEVPTLAPSEVGPQPLEEPGTNPQAIAYPQASRMYQGRRLHQTQAARAPAPAFGPALAPAPGILPVGAPGPGIGPVLPASQPRPEIPGTNPNAVSYPRTARMVQGRRLQEADAPAVAFPDGVAAVEEAHPLEFPAPAPDSLALQAAAPLYEDAHPLDSVAGPVSAPAEGPAAFAPAVGEPGQMVSMALPPLDGISVLGLPPLQGLMLSMDPAQVLAPLANPYPFPIPEGAVVADEEAAAGPMVGPPQPGMEGPRPIGPHPEDAEQVVNQGRRLLQIPTDGTAPESLPMVPEIQDEAGAEADAVAPAPIGPNILGAPRSQPISQGQPLQVVEVGPSAAPRIAPAPVPAPMLGADIGPIPLPRPDQSGSIEQSYQGRRLQQVQQDASSPVPADNSLGPVPAPIAAAAPSIIAASPTSGPAASMIDLVTAATPGGEFSGMAAAPTETSEVPLAATPGAGMSIPDVAVPVAAPIGLPAPDQHPLEAAMGGPAQGPAMLPAAGPVVGPLPLEPLAAAPMTNPNPALPASLPQPTLPLNAAGPVGGLAPAPAVSSSAFLAPALGPALAFAPAPLPNRLPALPEVQVLGLPALPEVNLPSDPSELLPFTVGYGPNPGPRVAPISITMGRKLKSSRKV